jgi:peptidoglycan/LPS O-acetylase OafA/YrhL
MSASSLSFRTAVVLGLLGIVMGIIMAASHDHSVMPAHAHLNLLGWVSLFLFGIYYRFHPTIDSSRLALTQVIVWALGAVVLAVGVAALNLGKPQAEPIAVVGSLLILADMVLFAMLVFRATDTVAKATSFEPAE